MLIGIRSAIRRESRGYGARVLKAGVVGWGVACTAWLIYQATLLTTEERIWSSSRLLRQAAFAVLVANVGFALAAITMAAWGSDGDRET